MNCKITPWISVFLKAIAYVREQTENQYIDIQSRFRLPDGSGHFVDVYVNGLHLNQDLVDKDFAVQKMVNAPLPSLLSLSHIHIHIHQDQRFFNIFMFTIYIE